MSLTAKEKRLAAECKYIQGGNIAWLARKLKMSRMKAYVVLARHYLDEGLED